MAGKRVQQRHDMVLVLLLIGGESGASFLNQSQSETQQNQSKRELPVTLN